MMMSEEGKSSSSVFNDLRLTGHFCDAVIKVDDEEFQVHKVILCNCSSYFQALFQRWSVQGRKVYNIPGLSPHMMKLIIDFAYTGSVSVDEDNVQELLLAADQLNVMEIVKTCFTFLGEHLCPENCIGIWQFTKVCFSSDLEHKACRFITANFEDVISCEAFQQLTVHELDNLLSRDDLNVRQESSAFQAVTLWIGHNPQERQEHLALLLSKVRLALTSVEYIRTKVMCNEFVRNNAECLEVLENLCDTNRAESFGVDNPPVHPRLPPAYLLAIGGWSGGEPTNDIEAYDVRMDCWINVTNHYERPRAYHGTAFINGFVYCIGGIDRMEQFSSVSKLDLSTFTWHEAAPMHFRRCYVSVTILDGCIYALGGYDGLVRLNTAERYRPETNQWSLIAPMHEQRSDASCTTLDNKVYICGGFNGSECLQTCEFYSPESNQWTFIAPMLCRRSGIGVIAYAGCVYAVGGFDGLNRLRSAEVYNPRINTWHVVSPMVNARSNFGIEVIDNLLFAVGGFNGLTTSNDVEYYDATTDMWSEVGDMVISRSALSCCVVSEVPDLYKFAVLGDDPLLFYFDGVFEDSD